MKNAEFEKLAVGEKITHKHYGVCTVIRYVTQFGPLILPDTIDGKALLFMHSGMKDTPLLETSKKLILNRESIIPTAIRP